MTYKDVFDIFSFSFQIIWKALAATDVTWNARIPCMEDTLTLMDL